MKQKWQKLTEQAQAHFDLPQRLDHTDGAA